jgi:hypothetical protein
MVVSSYIGFGELMSRNEISQIEVAFDANTPKRDRHSLLD